MVSVESSRILPFEWHGAALAWATGFPVSINAESSQVEGSKT